MLYDDYNREERALCAHLFRMLHEGLARDPKNSGLGRFLSAIQPAKGKDEGAFDPGGLSWSNVAIYSEVALIRDAYAARKKDDKRLREFMDGLITKVETQMGVQNCRPFSRLPAILCDPDKTHPKQIALKARTLHLEESEKFTNDEAAVYGVVQSMFNAKPDLAITVDNWLFVVEAKFTEAFDPKQLKLTEQISEVWRDLLFKEMGFLTEPRHCLVRLGLRAVKKDGLPFVSWEDVAEIAAGFYEKNDRSLIAIEKAVVLGKLDGLRIRAWDRG